MSANKLKTQLVFMLICKSTYFEGQFFVSGVNFTISTVVSSKMMKKVDFDRFQNKK